MRRKVVLLAVAVPVLLAGGGFVAMKALGAGEAAPEPPVTVALGEPFVVNLRDRGHFARAEILLKVAHDAEVEGSGGHGGAGAYPTLAENAAARDRVITTISRFSLEQLLAEAGRERLRANLRTEIERAAHVDVLDVLFTDFAVQ